MISAWTKHLRTEEEQNNFKNQILGSRQVLERLQSMLFEIEDDFERAETDSRIYEKPNWDYRQAHFNGFRDCLNKVNRILTLDHQKELVNERNITA